MLYCFTGDVLFPQLNFFYLLQEIRSIGDCLYIE
jgi:hypothetical protein